MVLVPLDEFRRLEVLTYISHQQASRQPQKAIEAGTAAVDSVTKPTEQATAPRA